MRVVKMVGAFDVGARHQSCPVRGQSGGLVMGVGYALTEGLVIQDGRVINPGYRDYKILRAPDAPEIGTGAGGEHRAYRPIWGQGVWARPP